MPTYNERDNLPDLVRARARTIRRLAVLVVDDGSPDGTGAIADELAREYPGPRRGDAPHRPARPRPLVRRRPAARARHERRRCHLPDGRRPVARPEVPAGAGAGGADHDLVIGSRYLHGVSVVNWPLHRIFLSAFANRYIRAVTGLTPRLHQRLPLLAARGAGAGCRSTAMVSDGYAFLIEMLFEAHGAAAGSAKCRSSSSSGAWALEGVGGGPARIAADAVAAAPAPPVRAAMIARQRRRHGDDVVSPVSRRQRRHLHGADRQGVAARGHEVHIVAPWHPRCTRGDERRRRHVPLLQVRAGRRRSTSSAMPAALRADVRLRGAA